MIVTTDSILWYNVGKYGEAGFAVPNPSDDPKTLNSNIGELVYLIGRNLFAAMRTEDTDMRTPPRVATLFKLHNLYVRTAKLISSRTVPHGEFGTEATHSTPSVEGFRLFPVPYFKVRSPFMRRWCKLVLDLLTECMQHTDNRRSSDITPEFGGMVGSYMNRMYQNMAMELFGKTRDQVRAPGFLLVDADFSGYDPAKFFTPTELIDPVSPFNAIFTEDELKVLSEGILAANLPASVVPYPGSGDVDPFTGEPAVAGDTQAAQTTDIFPAPPKP